MPPSFIGISQLTYQYVKIKDQKITPWMIEIALIGLRRDFSPLFEKSLHVLEFCSRFGNFHEDQIMLIWHLHAKK